MKLQFSNIEKQDLLKAWLAISIAFAIARHGLNFGNPQIILMSGLTVGVAFLIHEMAHKFVAQKYGMWAEFRADDMMLLLAIVVSFSGFVFAAPGAVGIAGYGSLEQEGKISLAGPLVNILLATLFVFGLWTLRLPLMLVPLFAYGFQINAWLALFNLIPFGPLDGVKIKRWNQTIWLAFFLLALFMTFGLEKML